MQEPTIEQIGPKIVADEEEPTPLSHEERKQALIERSKNLVTALTKQASEIHDMLKTMRDYLTDDDTEFTFLQPILFEGDIQSVVDFKHRLAAAAKLLGAVLEDDLVLTCMTLPASRNRTSALHALVGRVAETLVSQMSDKKTDSDTEEGVDE